MKKALVEKGVQPAFGPKKVFFHIYRREDAEARQGDEELNRPGTVRG